MPGVDVSALDALEKAFAAAPAIADLVKAGLDALDLADDDPRRPLAELVRARMPEKSKTREALDDLEEAEARRLAEGFAEDPPET